MSDASESTTRDPVRARAWSRARARAARQDEDCAQSERPCSFVSCAHHLYLDVSARTGAIKVNFPDLEIWEMTEKALGDMSALRDFVDEGPVGKRRLPILAKTFDADELASSALDAP